MTMKRLGGAGLGPERTAQLRDRGAVHGMAETSRMSDKDLADLVSFLETL